MTSLATLLGMIPMALGLEAGSEQYAPLARAVIGGLAASVAVTVFLVPAVYLLIHGRREAAERRRRGDESCIDKRKVREHRSTWLFDFRAWAGSRVDAGAGATRRIAGRTTRAADGLRGAESSAANAAER